MGNLSAKIHTKLIWCIVKFTFYFAIIEGLKIIVLFFYWCFILL